MAVFILLIMSDPIDFAKINCFEKGKWESFEQLVCVLARQNGPGGNSEFQRIEGSGGDGGVEALWVTENQQKWGFQAKYFLRSGGINWRQLDESVKKAIEVHQGLVKYYIAVPCDFTISARKKWNCSVFQWKKYASSKNAKIEFIAWTKFDLEYMLTSNEQNFGIIKYWFDDVFLNNSWFTHHIEDAIAGLEERYSPSEHVETSVEELFDTLVRGPGIRNEIDSCYIKLSNVQVTKITSDKIFCNKKQDLLQQFETAFDNLAATKTVFSPEYATQWKVENVIQAIARMRNVTDTIQKLLNEQKREQRKNSVHSVILSTEIVEAEIMSLIGICYDMSVLLRRISMTIESKCAAIIFGPAGIGKSHLLGHISDKRNTNFQPTLLLLGNKFENAEISSQIAPIINLRSLNFDEILSLLSAAAQRVNTRALILIDALNESENVYRWKNDIPSMLKKISRYPDVAIVFTCRQEYLKYAFSNLVIKNIPQYRIEGFQSDEEMEEAAIKYLDSKGIARPNTPWLAPEFRNPLFLKITCEALANKKETEFPSGLKGITEIMNFYFESLFSSIRIKKFDPSDLSEYILETVYRIAGHMAKNGCDYVEKSVAKKIVDECFTEFAQLSDDTWLNALIQQTSLFRRDPHPGNYIANSNQTKEVVRFSFQRFQDYLIAQSLTKMISKSKLEHALQRNGKLRFIFRENNHLNSFDYKYVGLLEALSTIYPEKYNVEFVNTIPTRYLPHLDLYPLQEAFIESCKWRNLASFNKSTGDVFRKLKIGLNRQIELRVEVSLTMNHPLNAYNLHEWLIEKTLSERDSLWSKWVNDSMMYTSSQVERLISWAQTPLSGKVDQNHLELAGLVLSWFFTSSNNIIRDRATKALTSILLKEAEVFRLIVKKFGNCNDPYLVERIYAAAYGACCIDQSAERLTLYASLVFDHVFSKKSPPEAILTRDYAVGIMELACSKGYVRKANIKKCISYCKSKPPNLNLTYKIVKKIAKKCGDESILHSCFGDFGRYVIPGRVGSYLTTEISAPKSTIEINQKIDVRQCQLWIAKRAYELGWKKDLFPNDGGGIFVSRHNNNYERIGKKYQRIALDELLARLSDNYWYLNYWPRYPTVSRYTHQNFIRNIEVSILPNAPQFAGNTLADSDWMINPKILLPKLKHKDYLEWPLQQDLATGVHEKLLRKDRKENEWMVLYEYQSRESKKNQNPITKLDVGEYHEFRFIFCVFVHKTSVKDFVSAIKNKKEIDVRKYEPSEYVDGPFLLEAYWRDTWESTKFIKDYDYDHEGCEYAIPTAKYQWESHLDKSLPGGYQLLMPQKWFAEELGICFGNSKLENWVDKKGEITFRTISPDKDHSVALINKKSLEVNSEKHELQPIWFQVSERNAWPEGPFGSVGYRRSEAIVWFQGKRKYVKSWKNDCIRRNNHKK